MAPLVIGLFFFSSVQLKHLGLWELTPRPVCACLSRLRRRQMHRTGRPLPRIAKAQPLSTEPHIDYSDPSTQATASGRGPSLGMGSRAKGGLQEVALSEAQRSRRETKWVPRALPGGTHSQVTALARR